MLKVKISNYPKINVSYESKIPDVCCMAIWLLCHTTDPESKTAFSTRPIMGSRSWFKDKMICCE